MLLHLSNVCHVFAGRSVHREPGEHETPAYGVTIAYKRAPLQHAIW